MTNIALRRWLSFPLHQARPSSRSIGWIALAVCILTASTYNVFAKILTGAISPLTLFFVSELLTGFFVTFSYGFMPVVRGLLQVKRKCVLPLLCIGLTNGTIAPLLLFPGLKMSSAVNASLFGNMEMVFLILLAVIALREPFRREYALSVCTMIAGMLIIALRGFTEGVELRMGDILLVLSSLSFATGSAIFRKYLHHLEPQIVLFVRSGVAITCFFLISPFLQHPLIEEIRAFPLAMLPVLIGFGFISRFLNIFSFYEALDRLPVTVVSLFSNLTVITSILFAWWILREPIAWYHIAGGILIVLGTLILEATGTHPTPRHLELHLRQRNGHR